MKKHIFTLLVVMLIMVVSTFAQQSPKREYIYRVSTRGIRGVGTIHHNGDSTALYQRVATGNPSEPYTTGAIVCWLHYPTSLYPNEPSDMIAEEEFGLYEKSKKEVYATVTIDGVRYFISAYDIVLNMPTSESWVHDWVYDNLPYKGSNIPWGKIFLFGIGGLLLLGLILPKRSRSSGGSSSFSSSSSVPSWELKRKEKEAKEAEEAKKRREEEEAYRKKIRKQNLGY